MPAFARENREGGAIPPRAQRRDGDCPGRSGHWRKPGRPPDESILSRKTGLETTSRPLGQAAAIARRQGEYHGDKRETYRGLKLEGILEAPINLCITCDRERNGPVVVGRTRIKTMDLYSSVCAVQNLWLAARAEDLGVGWVSIFHQDSLRKALGIPHTIVPVAYLCIGYVSHFYAKPELESAGWLPRRPLEELLHFEQWQGGADAEGKRLVDAVRERQAEAQRA